MRLSVASTGGATGSGSAGAAARFSAVYSLTGSTTQPSAELWAAAERTKTNRESKASAARDTGKRSRFMVILLLKIRVLCCEAHFETMRPVAAKSSPALWLIRDRGDLFVKLPLRCSE